VPQVTDANENANDLVQSHEFELQMGITDWCLLSVTAGLDQPLGENLQGSAVEIETEFALLKRHRDGIALSFQTNANCGCGCAAAPKAPPRLKLT
jgi:hypothetical protein